VDTLSRGTSIRCWLKIVETARSVPVVNQGGLGGFADVIERVAPGQVVNQIPPGPGADQAQTQSHGARDDREEFQSELGEHQTFNTWGSARLKRQHERRAGPSVVKFRV